VHSPPLSVTPLCVPLLCVPPYCLTPLCVCVLLLLWLSFHFIIASPGSDRQLNTRSTTPNSFTSSPAISTVSSRVNFPGLKDTAPVVVVLNNNTDKPLVSTSIRQAPACEAGHENAQFLKDQSGNKVKFLLGRFWLFSSIGASLCVLVAFSYLIFQGVANTLITIHF